MADTFVEVEGQSVRLLSPDEPSVQANACHVFIVGSKGIPAAYGGFETFVDRLTGERQEERICYHVARMAGDELRFSYHDAAVFDVPTPAIGPAKAIWYDVAALRRCFAWCREHPDVQRPVFYVLACRIGPFMGWVKHQVRRLRGVLLVNPDGHEWKRAKWSAPVRAYWRFSERLMVKAADLLVCDSRQIERYIREDYARYQPRTTFIAYGSDVEPSSMRDDDARYLAWLKQHGTEKNGYYLIVGRFVPENNYETMIRGFMASSSRRRLIIITNDNPSLLAHLQSATGFEQDERIHFAGTVYDQALLKKIREGAWGYLHGHEVGGTNPSLLEALGATEVNLLLDVGFNREVGEDAALYWGKDAQQLARLLDQADYLSASQRSELGRMAKARIRQAYAWADITAQYERLFLEVTEEKP